MADSKVPEKIKLVALDLDGTLLRSDRTIGARTLAAIREAQARGVEIVLASGRMTVAMEEAADALGFDPYLVSYNGAAVCAKKAHGRNILFHRPLDAKIARELYGFARERRLQVNYYLDGVIVTEDEEFMRPWIELYRERTGSPFRRVPSLMPFLDRAPTKLLFLMEPSRRAEIARHWRERLAERALVICTEHEYLEFLDPGATKGEAVAFVAQMLGVRMSSVMAMGDGDNDVPMLKMAGWSVAPANANPSALDAAKAITKATHENDAVAEAFEKWVLA